MPYIIFEGGEYSDFDYTVHKVLKPFTLADIISVVTECNKLTGKKRYGAEDFTPDDEQVIAFLNEHGYIEDTEDIPAIHLGSYNQSATANLSEEQANMVIGAELYGPHD